MNQFGNMSPRFWRGNDPLTFFQGLVSILGVLGLVLSAVLAVVGGGSSGSSDSRTPPPDTTDGFVVNPLARAVEEDEAKAYSRAPMSMAPPIPTAPSRCRISPSQMVH